MSLKIGFTIVRRRISRYKEGFYVSILCRLSKTLCLALTSFDVVAGANVNSTLSNPDILNTGLSLGVVILVIFLLAGMFKGFNRFSGRQLTNLKVIGGISLGSRERLLVVESGDVHMLLAVSSNGIVKLREYSAEEFSLQEAAHRAPLGSNTSSPFAENSS